MIEPDFGKSRELTAGMTAAPELSPKVAPRSVAHVQNQMPGCACVSVPAADDGHELQGARGRLGSRSRESGGLMQEGWMQKA